MTSSFILGCILLTSQPQNQAVVQHLGHSGAKAKPDRETQGLKEFKNIESEKEKKIWSRAWVFITAKLQRWPPPSALEFPFEVIWFLHSCHAPLLTQHWGSPPLLSWPRIVQSTNPQSRRCEQNNHLGTCTSLKEMFHLGLVGWIWWIILGYEFSNKSLVNELVLTCN